MDDRTYSPRCSSPSSSASGSPPTLSSDTLALLESFLSSKAEQEKRFHDLAQQAAERLPNAAQRTSTESEEVDPPMMSVDEYRSAFGEDWQLSQFWYSTPFATQLAGSIRSLCKPTSKVAFVCCPTGFVAFQHTNPLLGTRLFEFDDRFTVLAPSKVIHYDLNKPDVFPQDLREYFDIVVVDPPFLNESTNKNLIQTIRQIIHPERGKLILLTSTSTEAILQKLYDRPPVGPLRLTPLDPKFGGLANEFACWGSWEGAETFGKDFQ